MKKMPILLLVCICSLASCYMFADNSSNGFNVVPFSFDPAGTHLVAAEWKGGIGCPTMAPVAIYPSTSPNGPPYTDPACPTGDPRDNKVEGLLLAKTGPTPNNASAGATITGVKGITLTELGYDIRKPGGDTVMGPRGSHCGAGAPRFEIVTADGGTYAIGCNSPPPDVDTQGDGYQRLRWGGAVPLIGYPQTPTTPCLTPTTGGACVITGITVKQLSIIFDEGYDTGPDNFGLAVLDNIDINGTMVGRGPTRVEEQDEDKGQGQDNTQGNFQFHDSQSRPETSNLSYQNQVDGVRVQSINGATSVSYNAGCVTFVGDALLNNEPGYTLTFAACNVLVLGVNVGNISVSVIGPNGVAYQKNASLTSGAVQIHGQ